MLCFRVLWGLSIKPTIFKIVQTVYSIPLQYNPIKLSAFLLFQKTNKQKNTTIYDLLAVFPIGQGFRICGDILPPQCRVYLDTHGANLIKHFESSSLMHTVETASGDVRVLFLFSYKRNGKMYLCCPRPVILIAFERHRDLFAVILLK